MASPVVFANLVETDCVCKVEGAATGNKALLQEDPVKAQLMGVSPQAVPVT